MGCEDKFCDERSTLATENVGVNIVQMLGINKWGFVPNESVPRKDSYHKIRMFRISTAAIGVGDTVRTTKL
ncbi:hypothetical protein NQ317_017259 [Molorchus minor]|uniref:Uncharacterized protein n=1 Tax=Molorchus minor TaxID=1323400 RepID=A0ABQ9JTZ2_9CUCU|nr:hypothetical protein NQ317_017259 [Molorchus minor]